MRVASYRPDCRRPGNGTMPNCEDAELMHFLSFPLSPLHKAYTGGRLQHVLCNHITLSHTHPVPPAPTSSSGCGNTFTSPHLGCAHSSSPPRAHLLLGLWKYVPSPLLPWVAHTHPVVPPAPTYSSGCGNTFTSPPLVRLCPPLQSGCSWILLHHTASPPLVRLCPPLQWL